MPSFDVVSKLDMQEIDNSISNSMKFNNSLSKKFTNSGTLICGKSATPEFGLMITTEPKAFKPTRNPWDRERSTGGSSGGAGSAVASRAVPIAHASDGGGSIRIPAATCGTVGLKPTRGRISFSPSHGDKWGGLTHSGILSRTVRDTAYMYNELFSSEIGDPYSVHYEKGSLINSLNANKKYKIGFNTESRLPITITSDAKNAVMHNAKLCESIGHKDNKISYVCATIGSYIAMLSGLSFLGVGLTPADLYFHEHVFFVFVGFRSMVPAMVFLTLAFFFSPVSNKYTVASVLFLLSITLYAFFETSDPPDVSPRENLELFKESVSYNRMVISVIAQKVITLISFVSFFVFTYGFYQLSLLKK